MPITTTTYNILISCPGDIKEEIKIIDKAVQEFNDRYSNAFHISLQTKHWEKSSFSQSGGHPQQILNEQFVTDCDAAIAVFWTRFGTPTDEYGSGSEEEINLMLNSGKQVFMYFSERSISPQQIDHEQYKQVERFKERYKEKGLYKTYKTLEDFEAFVSGDIIKYFIEQADRNEKRVNKDFPDVVLQGYNHGEIEDYGLLTEWLPEEFDINDDRVVEIKNTMMLIGEYGLEDCEDNENVSPFGIPIKIEGLYTPVTINTDTQDTIKMFANRVGIDLSDDFFSMGDLKWNNIHTDIYGHKKMNGSMEYAEKYDAIIELKDSIYDILARKQIAQHYSGIKGVQLVISNKGTSYDEDIDVELVIPKDVLIDIKKLEPPEDKWLDWLSSDDDPAQSLFAIPGDAKCFDYDSSLHSSRYSVYMGNPLSKSSSQKVYKQRIEDIFSYDIYPSDSFTKIRIHFDYIKQHTVVSFPTMLFLNLEDDEMEIDYSIISKRSPIKKEGIIKIKKEKKRWMHSFRGVDNSVEAPQVCRRWREPFHSSQAS